MATAPSSVKIKDPAPCSVENKERAGKGSKSGAVVGGSTKVWPWKTLLGLSLILIELLLNTGIIWGVFMLLWAIMGISSGQTYILEVLERRLHPVLFWITIHLWLLIAAFFFMSNPHIYTFFEMLIT